MELEEGTRAKSLMEVLEHKHPEIKDTNIKGKL